MKQNVIFRFLPLAILVALAADVRAAAVGEDLVVNFDQSQDNGIGMPLGWLKWIGDMHTTTLDVTPSSDGSVSFRAQGKSYAFYEQRGLKLVPGAAYRLSYEVSTSGLHGEHAYVFLRDNKWSWKEVQRLDFFPQDTQGKWVAASGTVHACANEAPKECALSICVLQNARTDQAVEFKLRNLRLEALSEDVAAASAPASGNALRILPARIVPIDPLLSEVSASRATMTFYWPGSPKCGVTNCLLEATLRDKKTSARFGADGRATVDFGRQRAGATDKVQVRVLGPDGQALAMNRYGVTFVAPVPPAAETGRRLNNLVTELVNAPLTNGTYAFSRPTKGWVWISFEGTSPMTEGYLDNIGYPVVRKRGGERYLETQRFVEAGTHALHVVGATGGRLRIHAVKTIGCGAARHLTTGPCGGYRWGMRYTLPFLERFGILSVNNLISTRVESKKYLDPEFLGFYGERGMWHVVSNNSFSPFDPDRDSYEATWKRVANKAWEMGLPIAIDENNIVTDAGKAVNFSEVAWRMLDERPHQHVSLYYADTSKGNYYYEPQRHVSEISAIVNSGDGTGLLCPELYAPVLENRATLDVYIDRFAKIVESAVAMVPASRGKVLLYGASYVDIGDWSCYTCPSADIKAYLSEMYRAYATNPRFAECAGIGFGGLMCGTEELRRWGARCLRYYALEGGTENLAEKYGFGWTPGLVRNPDMDEGLVGWTAEGAIAPDEPHRRFGSDIQQRRCLPPGSTVGNHVLTFTARDEAANVLRQEVTGLVPGRHYALFCIVTDRDSVGATDKKREPRFAFTADLEGASEVKELAQLKRRINKDFNVAMHSLRQVFRAERETATLVFRDRDPDGAKLPAGARQSLNYVILAPYYSEGLEEVSEIAEALGWTAGTRIRKDIAR